MSTQEKCYDPADTTIRPIIGGKDDMDLLYTGYKSLRARMSCGHTVTPMSLTDYCRRLLDQGKNKFVCGNCNAEWPYEEVRKMALLTPEEMKYFEKKLFESTASNYKEIKKCPGCKAYVTRTDLSKVWVRCTLCTANKKKIYEFCWQCLREWKGPAPHAFHCAYDDCIGNPQILKTCSDIIFEEIKDVRGCPSVRACPTCGLLISHDGTKCKNVVCGQCTKEFCFVCLKLTKECLKTSSYYKPCSSGVAPRQTSIPVWKK